MSVKNNSYDFLKYKSILILGKDDKINEKVKNFLTPHINNVLVLKNIPKYLNLSLYDLVIVDMDYYEKKEILHTFSNDYYNTPIIFLTLKIEDIDFNYFQNTCIKNVLLKEVNLDNIFIYIYLILQQSDKIIFKDGFLYSLVEDRFYCHTKEVALTKLELELFKYLVKNQNRIIDYEEIKKNVWKNKDCTIYSVRNVINKIREKSYYEIISNISKQGYTINNN